MELQKMKVWKYAPGGDRVCTLRYTPKPLTEETLCGLDIYERTSSAEFQNYYVDAIEESFPGGYDNIACCNCLFVIDRFIEQSKGEVDVELQKMKAQNGEVRVCAVRFTPAVERFAEETLCGISYVTDARTIEWIKDRFPDMTNTHNPIDKLFYGRCGDITCPECRDVIEYYISQKTSKT